MARLRGRQAGRGLDLTYYRSNTLPVTKRTAISLPDSLFRDIERARKRDGLDRSGWLQEAAKRYLTRRVTQEQIDMYFEGYRRIPDTDDDFRAFERAGIEALRSWDAPAEVSTRAKANRARRDLVGRPRQATTGRRPLAR